MGPWPHTVPPLLRPLFIVLCLPVLLSLWQFWKCRHYPALSTNRRPVTMDTPGWAATAFHIIQEEEEQTSGFMCGGWVRGVFVHPCAQRLSERQRQTKAMTDWVYKGARRSNRSKKKSVYLYILLCLYCVSLKPSYCLEAVHLLEVFLYMVQAKHRLKYGFIFLVDMSSWAELRRLYFIWHHFIVIIGLNLFSRRHPDTQADIQMLAIQCFTWLLLCFLFHKQDLKSDTWHMNRWRAPAISMTKTKWVGGMEPVRPQQFLKSHSHHSDELQAQYVNLIVSLFLLYIWSQDIMHIHIRCAQLTHFNN